MSSKTKIVVLHLKEVIYTGIFAALAILLIIVLVIMFAPGKEKNTQETTVDSPTSMYVPGVYTTTLNIGDSDLDIAVTVDDTRINSVELINLSEAVTTMYPLIQPSFEDIASQIMENQSLEQITYPDESHYTSLILLDAIRSSLKRACLTEDAALPLTENP